MTVHEIAKQYPEEWVAMLPNDNTVRDLHPEHRGLRVWLHSKDVHDFDAELIKHHEYGHPFRIYVTYTGVAPPPNCDLTLDIASGKMVAIELELLQEGVRRCRCCRGMVYPVVTRGTQDAEWARYKLYWNCECRACGWAEVGLEWHADDRELSHDTAAFEVPEHLAASCAGR